MLSGILAIGSSAVQAEILAIKKGFFNIQSGQKYSISNIHIVRERDGVFLRGSVGRRFGKSPLLSGHVDIAFLNSDGEVMGKECVYFDHHYSKRSCELHADFEFPLTEDQLSSNTIKISYIAKK